MLARTATLAAIALVTSLAPEASARDRFGVFLGPNGLSAYYSTGGNSFGFSTGGFAHRPHYSAPAYHAPARSYYAPAPVYYAPAYYAPAPAYYAPAPVYYAPVPVYVAPHSYHGAHHYAPATVSRHHDASRHASGHHGDGHHGSAGHHR